jgi:hypothetical protein
MPDLIDAVENRLTTEPGIASVQSSRRTGSVLVLYEPRELELPRILSLIVSAARLNGIEVDAPERESRRAPQGDRVRERCAAANRVIGAMSQGTVDLTTAVPGALAASALAMLVLGRRSLPRWYDLAFWAFVTFTNLNPPRAARRHDAVT